jgi:hypothetical protein
LRNPWKLNWQITDGHRWRPDALASGYLQLPYQSTESWSSFYSRLFEENKELWNVILGVAGTLKSLELRFSNTPPYAREISWKFRHILLRNSINRNMVNNPSELDSFDIKPLRLDPLESLQRLKSTHFDWWQLWFLASSTAPVDIRSIILETSFLQVATFWRDFGKLNNLWILCTVEDTVNDYPPAGFELEMEDFLKKKGGLYGPATNYFSTVPRFHWWHSTTLDSRKQIVMYDVPRGSRCVNALREIRSHWASSFEEKSSYPIILTRYTVGWINDILHA